MTVYCRLVLAAGGCGVVMGIAMIVASWNSQFFVPALIVSLVVPAGSGIALGRLGILAREGSRTAFYASWIVAGVLMIPVSIAVYVLILARRPISVVEELPQMGIAEKVALASLAICLPVLVAIVVVGVCVRASLRNESNHGLLRRID